MVAGTSKAFALVLVTTLLCLAAGEWVARIALEDITTTSDNRSYFALKWKAANVRLNSFGYRDREFRTAKSDGTFRIAFIGDSFTFGQGIPVESRMSNILERELNRQDLQVEVLNLSAAGHNTADEVRVLKMALDRLDPDLVVLQWFVNDVEVPPESATGARSAGQGGQSRLNALKMKLRNHSALYFLAAETWHRFLDRTSASHTNDMLRRFGDPQSDASRRADTSLLEFIGTTKAKAVPLAILLVPQLAPIGQSGYRFAYLHDRVLAICHKETVTCVDLLQTFSPLLASPEGAKSLWVNRFDSHMGSESNELAASELLRVLQAAGLVPLADHTASTSSSPDLSEGADSTLATH